VKRLRTFGADFIVDEDTVTSREFKNLITDLPAPRLALNCVGGKNATEIARLLGFALLPPLPPLSPLPRLS